MAEKHAFWERRSVMQVGPVNAGFRNITARVRDLPWLAALAEAGKQDGPRWPIEHKSKKSREGNSVGQVR